MLEALGDQVVRCRLIENRYIIHEASAAITSARSCSEQRTFGPFIAPNAAVAVDGHDQHIAQGARVGEAAHVAGMNQIETAVGEYNSAPARAFRAP